MRLAATLCGCGVLALVWCTGLLDALPAFTAHMFMHMSVVAVASPLLAIGLAGSHFDPALRWAWLLAPLPASALELVIVWAWHAPALHDFARHSASGKALEQGSFLLASLLVWLSAYGGERSTRRLRAGGGIAGLLMTSMHMTLLGALLALTPRTLYSHGQGHGHGHAYAAGHGLDALQDQHLGGVIMLLAGGISYAVGALWLLAGLLRPPSARELRA